MMNDRVTEQARTACVNNNHSSNTSSSDGVRHYLSSYHLMWPQPTPLQNTSYYAPTIDPAFPSSALRSLSLSTAAASNSHTKTHYADPNTEPQTPGHNCSRQEDCNHEQPSSTTWTVTVYCVSVTNIGLRLIQIPYHEPREEFYRADSFIDYMAGVIWSAVSSTAACY